MAEQMGMFPLKGSIGNINFFKLGDRYFARGKGGVSADRFATDRKFERSRESSAEFGAASRAGKLLRITFQEFAHANADNFMARRLRSAMIAVLQADATNARGKRRVVDGNAKMLEGFEFNERGKLTTTFAAPYTCDINRVTGEMKVSIPIFIPERLINAPKGTTHFKFISAGAEVDFEKNSHKTDVHSSSILSWNTMATDEIVFTNNVQANSTLPLFLVLGLEFYQELNATMYRLKDVSFNALAIVKVSAP